MESRTSRRSLVRGIAVVGAVLLAAGAISPALSAFKATKGKIKKISRKEATKVLDGVLHQFGDSFTRVVATPGPDEATARASAPKVPLATYGPFSFYAKCFSYPVDTVRGEIYVETTQAGSILSSNDGDDLPGGPLATDFLNPSTPEVDRQLYLETTLANDANYSPEDDDDNHLMAPDGTALDGKVQGAVKNGTLAEGNGVYGDGDVCLFAGNFVGT